MSEYLSSAVNALTNSVKIWYPTESDFFQPNLPQIDEKSG